MSDVNGHRLGSAGSRIGVTLDFKGGSKTWGVTRRQVTVSRLILESSYHGYLTSARDGKKPATATIKKEFVHTVEVTSTSAALKESDMTGGTENVLADKAAQVTITHYA